MEENMAYILVAGIIALVVIIFVAIRVTATKNTFMGKICRWYWNTSFKIASYIPFCGWMAKLMVTVTEEERRMKEVYVSLGRGTDAAASRELDRQVAANEARKRRDERVRRELAAKGLTVNSVSDDGSQAYCRDRRGNEVVANITWE